LLSTLPQYFRAPQVRNPSDPLAKPVRSRPWACHSRLSLLLQPSQKRSDITETNWAAAVLQAQAIISISMPGNAVMKLLQRDRVGPDGGATEQVDREAPVGLSLQDPCTNQELSAIESALKPVPQLLEHRLPGKDRMRVEANAAPVYPARRQEGAGHPGQGADRRRIEVGDVPGEINPLFRLFIIQGVAAA
jgi:hypothetical protein